MLCSWLFVLGQCPKMGKRALKQCTGKHCTILLPSHGSHRSSVGSLSDYRARRRLALPRKSSPWGEKSKNVWSMEDNGVPGWPGNIEIRNAKNQELQSVHQCLMRTLGSRVWEIWSILIADYKGCCDGGMARSQNVRWSKTGIQSKLEHGYHQHTGTFTSLIQRQGPSLCHSRHQAVDSSALACSPTVAVLLPCVFWRSLANTKANLLFSLILGPFQ